MSSKGKSIEIESRFVIVIESRFMTAWDWKLGKWRLPDNGQGISFGDDENILKLVYGDGCATL